MFLTKYYCCIFKCCKKLEQLAGTVSCAENQLCLNKFLSIVEKTELILHMLGRIYY